MIWLWNTWLAVTCLCINKQRILLKTSCRSQFSASHMNKGRCIQFNCLNCLQNPHQMFYIFRLVPSIKFPNVRFHGPGAYGCVHYHWYHAVCVSAIAITITPEMWNTFTVRNTRNCVFFAMLYENINYTGHATNYSTSTGMCARQVFRIDSFSLFSFYFVFWRAPFPYNDYGVMHKLWTGMLFGLLHFRSLIMLMVWYILATLPKYRHQQSSFSTSFCHN